MQVEKLDDFLWLRLSKEDKKWLIDEGQKRDRQIGYLARLAIKKLRKDVEEGKYKNRPLVL